MSTRAPLVALSFAVCLGCGSSAGTTPSLGSGGDDAGGTLHATTPGAQDASSFVLGGDAGAGTLADASGGDDCGTSNLTGTIRDFRFSHPDFEHFTGDGETGVLEAMIGADDKPVYIDVPHTMFTTKANFDQWYRDTAGINIAIPYTLSLTKNADGTSTFDEEKFFPIDDQGWGDEGVDDDGTPHNYSFTFELHTTIAYQGGEAFTFTGDDDLWTFINGHLAIDLGGVHVAHSKTLDLDAAASDLGLEKGKSYSMAVFQAERHTTGSHFRIDTTLSFSTCAPSVH